jgi:flagellar assembly factor FliW
MTAGVMDAPMSAATQLRFPTALPGFPGAERFSLEPWGGEDSPFALLRCLDEPAIEFVVTHPHVFFPDYAPEVDDATVERLGIASADDVMLLVILTLGDAPQDATANLLGPIVVNRHSGEAVQAVLAASDLPLRAPLVPAA